MKKTLLRPLLFFVFSAISMRSVAASGPTPNEVVASATPTEWKPIAPDDLLIMELGEQKKGASRRVVIQLMPSPFSEGWVRNIRKLAEANWWSGTAIVRVQDNYVVQWGDPHGENPKLAKKLPTDLAVMREAEYTVPSPRLGKSQFPDAYAPKTGFLQGWPIAGDDKSSWPVHCYGAVGVGRNLSPDTGSGAELYAVIGHAPRHLDRNIAVVGRIIEGIEHLTSLPRGTGALGFYEGPEERVVISSIRLMRQLPAKERVQYEYLDTESTTFARYVQVRANRKDDFYFRPAGGVDLCNVPVPVRKR